MADPKQPFAPERPTVVVTIKDGIVVDITSDVRALSYVVLDLNGVETYGEDIARVYDSVNDVELFAHVEYGDTTFEPDFCDDANDPVFLDEDEIAVLREHGPRGLTRATAVPSAGREAPRRTAPGYAPLGDADDDEEPDDAELEAQLTADGADLEDEYEDEYEDDALDRAERDAERPWPPRVVRDAPGA